MAGERMGLPLLKVGEYFEPFLRHGCVHVSIRILVNVVQASTRPSTLLHMIQPTYSVELLSFQPFVHQRHGHYRFAAASVAHILCVEMILPGPPPSSSAAIPCRCGRWRSIGAINEAGYFSSWPHSRPWHPITWVSRFSLPLCLVRKWRFRVQVACSRCLCSHCRRIDAYGITQLDMAQFRCAFWLLWQSHIIAVVLCAYRWYGIILKGWSISGCALWCNIWQDRSRLWWLQHNWKTNTNSFEGEKRSPWDALDHQVMAGRNNL